MSPQSTVVKPPLKMTLHFLHGFLGCADDFSFFKEHFLLYKCKFYEVSHFMPDVSDVCEIKNESSAHSFNSWAEKFNHAVFESKNQNKLHRNILIGYSLGGRLALHSLIQKNSWDAVILISTHPGLQNVDEQFIRLQNDRKWAYRFLNEPWDIVMDDWNAQDVFANKKNSLQKSEAFYNKKQIFQMIENFSLGKQIDFREKIKYFSLPILWISGEEDVKFALLSQQIKILNPNITTINISNAAHRIPWENPNAFVKEVKKFLGTHFESP